MPTTPPSPVRSNLRTYTIGVLLLVFVAFALLQWISARWLYDDSFHAAERRDALSRARHAQALLRNRTDYVRNVAFDDANWDEAYLYMLGKNPGHPEREFGPINYHSLHMDGFAFVGADGRLVDVERFDPTLDAFVPAGPEWREVMQAQGAIGSNLDPKVDSSGFAVVGGALHAWGAAPIVHSNGTGQPVGHLAILTPLDDEFLESTTKTVDSVVQLKVRPLGAGPGEAHMPLEYAEAHFVERGDQQLETTFPMGKVASSGVLEVGVSGPRDVHEAALRTSRYFLWSTLAFGTVLSALALRFVDRRLLKPVQSASEMLVEIGRTADLSARLAAAPHNDQIGELVVAANQMLASLEGARGAEAARDAAVSASRMKSEFLARMSHEIRTPMNGVLGMAELMKTTALTMRQRRFLDVIHRSAESLLALINDILDFSKVEAGRLELQAIEFSPGETAEDAAELLAQGAHRKGLELVVQIDPSVPDRLIGDPTRLRQILTNLVGNAIKFTEQGDVVVRMSAVQGQAGRVVIECSVCDTGIGISAQALAGIFESFNQADMTVTRRFGGTGLGLPIARHLARLMGGDIRATSEPGRGSTFTLSARFDLPASQINAQPDPAAFAPRLLGVSVLVVDPHAVQRRVFSEQLALAGAQVTLAQGGTDAIWKLRESTYGDAFHAMVLDCRSIDSECLSFLSQVRSEPGLEGLRIVAVFRCDVSELAASTAVAGVDAQLTQPVAASRLIGAIAELLEVGAVSRASETPAAATGSAACAGVPLRVLLAEDNPINREVAFQMLLALECEVRTAENGRDAVQIWEQSTPDLVLMDIQMPEMDGMAATREIRRQEALSGRRSVPIVAVTAHAMQREREECMRAGMNGFLSKPFSKAQLAQLLQSWRKRDEMPADSVS